mmetsp:Transcript_3485/g.11405  ORF Transcript_3485/g.11405 Transcript_3485/m.11405 type:complete len:271 (+) Transcript_3485:437-1249(+)
MTRQVLRALQRRLQLGNGEVTGDGAGEEANGDEAKEHPGDGKGSTSSRSWNLVAVPDGGHGDGSPHGGPKDAGEVASVVATEGRVRPSLEVPRDMPSNRKGPQHHAGSGPNLVGEDGVKNGREGATLLGAGEDGKTRLVYRQGKDDMFLSLGGKSHTTKTNVNLAYVKGFDETADGREGYEDGGPVGLSLNLAPDVDHQPRRLFSLLTLQHKWWNTNNTNLYSMNINPTRWRETGRRWRWWCSGGGRVVFVVHGFCVVLPKGYCANFVGG